MWKNTKREKRKDKHKGRNSEVIQQWTYIMAFIYYEAKHFLNNKINYKGQGSIIKKDTMSTINKEKIDENSNKNDNSSSNSNNINKINKYYIISWGRCCIELFGCLKSFLFIETLGLKLSIMLDSKWEN